MKGVKKVSDALATFVVWSNHQKDPRGKVSWALANDIRLYKKGIVDRDNLVLAPGINHERLNDWLFGPISTMGENGVGLTTKAELFNDDGSYKGNVKVDDIATEVPITDVEDVERTWAEPREGAVIMFRPTRVKATPAEVTAAEVGRLLKIDVPQEITEKIRKDNEARQPKTVRWPTLEPLKESWSDVLKKEKPWISEGV